MNKMMTILALLLLSKTSYAQPKKDIEEYIEFGLIDRISAIGQLDSRGTSRVGIVSSPIRAGKIDGQTIVHLQAGVSWDTKADNQDDQGATPIVGVLFRLDPFIRPYLPKNQETLHNLEHGLKVDYDFHAHEAYINYQAGFTFNFKPVQ